LLDVAFSILDSDRTIFLLPSIEELYIISILTGHKATFPLPFNIIVVSTATDIVSI
jgi:hypothetical protein